MRGRVLITGAQGFTGRYLVAHLLRRHPGVQILGCGRSAGDGEWFTHAVHWARRPVRAPLPEELRVDDPRYGYRSVDLLRTDELGELLRDYRPEVVVHLASSLRDDPPSQLFPTNVEGTISLVSALAALPNAPKRVVFASSGAVYGIPAAGSLPLTEESPCQPADLYSVSKLAAELASRILCRQSGIPAVWARIFNPVGPGQDERHVCGQFAAQIAAIARGALAPRVEVGDLTPTRDFIDIRDVAAALGLLAEKGAPGGTYNVASGTETPVQRILDLLLTAARLQSAVRIEPLYRRPADIPRHFADTTALTDLGFACRHSLRRSLRDTMGYYLETVGKEEMA